jgi:hypothetical protein
MKAPFWADLKMSDGRACAWPNGRMKDVLVQQAVAWQMGYRQTELWRPLYQSTIFLAGLVRVKVFTSFMT